MPGTEALDVNAFVAELQQQAAAANAGNLARSEAMLVTQAHTLDSLFHFLVSKSMANASAGYLPAAETYMRLALKAQSQCRATNETLAEIKNPPIIYARQANIAAGHQQINNAAQPSGVREMESAPSKLLEADHGQRLDPGAALAPGGANQAMEAVGVQHGAAVCGGKGKGGA